MNFMMLRQIRSVETIKERQGNALKGRFTKVFALAIAAALLGNPAAHAAAAVPTLVQSASSSSLMLDVPTCTAEFSSNNTAGHLIVVAVTIGAAGTDRQPTVTDIQGNTYYPATAQVTWKTSGGGTSSQLFYAANVRGGSNIVTMTQVAAGTNGALGGAGSAYNSISIHEYAGVALASPLDVSSAASGISTGSPFIFSSGSATSVVNGELIFGYGNDGGGSLSNGAGFAVRETACGVTEDAVQTTAGPVAATESESWSNMPGVMLMAAFRPVVPVSALELPFQANRSAMGQVALAITNTAVEPNAGATATQTILFTYANRAALVADGWNFIATRADGSARDTETTSGPGMISYAQNNGTFGTVMRVPCDVGDLYGADNTSTNSLFRNLSTNWVSMRQSFSLAATVNFQQAHLGIYQDDDNYVDVGLAFNSSLGGEAVTMVAETNGVPRHYYSDVFWYLGGPGSPPVTNLFLRLDRDQGTGNIKGFCSLDGVFWAFVGEFGQTLVNPRLTSWVGGSPVPYTNGLPKCDMRQLDIVTANPLPALTYQLLSPPTGAVIDRTSGIISWTPGAAQAPATYLLTTMATDPALSVSVTNSFSVAVKVPLTVTGISAGKYYFTVPTVAGQTYQVVFKNDLSAATWTPLGNQFAGTGDAVTVTNDMPGPQRYFRVNTVP
jgi:hypothetical protein